MRRFQRAIVCHQRIKIGKDIELWPNPKVGVNGRIIVIFANIENFDFSLWIVSLLLAELSCLTFFRDGIGSKACPWKIWTSFVFLFLRNNSAKLSNAHFPIQIHFSALWINSLIVFFVLNVKWPPSVIQMGHFYGADNFLGHFEEVYLPQSLTQA